MKEAITIRRANESEFLKVYQFVSNCKPLENYSEHFYKIILRYFGNSCFVAEYNDSIIGFVMSFISQTHNKTYFLWQIGVTPKMHGKGIGRKLLESVEVELAKMGCDRIELTIDPKNIPSMKLFEKAGYKNISEKEGSTLIVDNNIAVKDYYKSESHFMLYEKNFS
ncbi:MAG: GNAT family N-acetyltransferase [bacterium]|nr:GNAT family N-acetyltransferase [bacterium]